MQVKSLELRAWLGLNGVTQLKERNLLVGPVGSGKTAHLHALYFAVTGSSILGQRPQSAIGFGGPNGCMVGVRLDDGFAFDRGLHVTRKNGVVSKVSATMAVRGMRISPKAAEEMVHSRVKG